MKLECVTIKKLKRTWPSHGRFGMASLRKLSLNLPWRWSIKQARTTESSPQAWTKGNIAGDVENDVGWRWRGKHVGRILHTTWKDLGLFPKGQ